VRDLAGTVQREGPAGGPTVSHYRIADMEVDFELRPEHLVMLIDAVGSGALGVPDLETLCTCLEFSERFLRDADTPDGERVADALFWLANPSINYPLTPRVLAKVRHYLLTGENELTRDDTRTPRETT
jgi:hypothetical protein